MKKFFLALLALPLVMACSHTSLDYVNPFVGTDGHGHTTPAAITPFGMIQVGPDTRLDGWDGCSGYHYSDDTIYGFSHTHLSGTGCSDYGDVLLMPFTDTMSVMNKKYCSTFKHSHEKAHPGYYSVILDKIQVKAELTASRRVAYHHYYYPQRKQKGFIIDLTHRDVTKMASIRCHGSHITGSRRSSAWNPDQQLFFAIQVDNPVDSIVLYKDNRPVRGTSELTGENIKAAVYLSSETNIATIRVAISSVDTNGALANLRSEPTKTFKQARRDAEHLWRNELDKIEVQGGTKQNRISFYTALYHCMTSPYLYNDVNGRYRGMDNHDSIFTTDGKHNRYTVFSLWDTYRALHPLLALIDRHRTEDFIYTFDQQYRQSGELTMWELSGHETHCMIGYHSAPVILEAQQTGILDSLSQETRLSLLQGLIATSNRDEGQRFYAAHGYLSSDVDNESVSKTLEYAYDDWCIAMLAKAYMKTIKETPAPVLDTAKAAENVSQNVANTSNTAAYSSQASIEKNNPESHPESPTTPSVAATPNNVPQNAAGITHSDLQKIYKEYMRRAQSWKNIMDAQGFMHPRRNGGFITPFSPVEVNNHFTEANSWQYSTYVPQDVEGWAKMLGGDKNAIAMLDSLFNTSGKMEGRQQSDITGLIGQYAHGNEPSHHAAYLYAYLGQQWKSAKLVRKILNEFYTDKPDGLIGNEDCGQMSAWMVMSSLGFYEVCPGSGEYVIGSPLFKKAVIHLENGKNITINCSKQSPKNCYVKSLMLNGKDHPSCVLTYEELKNGATLDFVMSNKPIKEFGGSTEYRAHSHFPQNAAITPIPAFGSWQQRFDGIKQVSLSLSRGAAPGTQIYYTVTSGDESSGYPDTSSTLYAGPITVSEDTKIAAVAWNPVTGYSNVVTQTLTHFNADKKVTYLTKPAQQYYDSGEDGLIDGIMGTTNYRVGGWEGWQGDMKVVVDLLSDKPVHSIGVNCLSSTKSWIFLPQQVIVEASNDGKTYHTFGQTSTGLAAIVEQDVNRGYDYQEGTGIHTFWVTGNTAAVRYLRITVKNYGKLPKWHISAGEQAWLFCDEIMVN